jgi:uncharacterized membrane protein
MLRGAKSQKADIFISIALKTFCLAVVKEVVSCTLIEVCENVLVAAGVIYIYIWGRAVASWLRLYATNRYVAGSIPDGVIGIFQ